MASRVVSGPTSDMQHFEHRASPYNLAGLRIFFPVTFVTVFCMWKSAEVFIVFPQGRWFCKVFASRIIDSVEVVSDETKLMGWPPQAQRVRAAGPWRLHPECVEQIGHKECSMPKAHVLWPKKNARTRWATKMSRGHRTWCVPIKHVLWPWNIFYG